MKKYIGRRLVLFIPTLLGVSIAIFILLRVLPGDPAEAMLAGPEGDAFFSEEDLQRVREQMGLDKPIYVQYLSWIGGLLTGDLGFSVAKGRPIADDMKRQFPVSLQLGIFAIMITWIIAIPIGILAAVKQDGWVDYIMRAWPSWAWPCRVFSSGY